VHNGAEQAGEGSMERMTRGQWVTGCLVVLGAAVGAAVSSPWAERTFSPPANANADQGTAAEHKRTCITLGGKRFEWNFPNPPFGTLSCSE
jgi:hypothetical protein